MIIPDTLGICHFCFEPVWADQSYIFVEGGRPVHKICYLRQPESYRRDNLPEGSSFVNEWKKGRIAWRCSKCGKGLWLDPGVYEKAYRDSEVCLDCRALMKRMESRGYVQGEEGERPMNYMIYEVL